MQPPTSRVKLVVKRGCEGGVHHKVNMFSLTLENVTNCRTRLSSVFQVSPNLVIVVLSEVVVLFSELV